MEIHADVSVAQRLFFGIVCVGSMALLGLLILKRNLEVRYALIWIPPFVGGAALAVFPKLLHFLASALGFQVASNALLSLAILGLLYITLLQTLALGRAKRDIRELAQKVALELQRDPPSTRS